jgi:hypothetical protein
MKVYHSSNVKINVLHIGAYVTPDKEISKIFGRQKPGNVHYCHEFEAKIRDYPRMHFHGRMILDVSAGLTGQLELSPTPEGEDWKNYVTTALLRPISIMEY